MLTTEVSLAWRTQAGHRHLVEGLSNEDAVFVTHEHPRFDAVLVVADGMGGHPRPQEASESAVRAAREVLFDPDRGAGGGLPRLLAAAMEAAHRAVRKLRGGSARPPGTTLSIAVAAEGGLHVAHVGDGSVFLMRGGQVRGVAGGEDRRSGNRPAQFLGQDGPLDPEVRHLPLAAGDRVMLCTDGLTRYFREAGPEALERVLGRQGVEIQAIAGQLTAHSRPDEYDDDTTVALLEVTGLAEAPARPVSPKAPARPAREEDVPPMPAPTPSPSGRRGGSPLGIAAAMTAGAALLAAGFAAGRASAPKAAAAPGLAPATPERRPADPDALASLPPGNLILVDALGSRVFALSTRDGTPGAAPIQLDALKVSDSGRLTAAGRFRLDPVKAELTDPAGRRFPVETDYSRGTLRILRGGTLVINSSPAGARVFVDGREVGEAPLRLAVTAGEHRVRVQARAWSSESEVQVPAGRSVTLTLGAP